MKMSGDFTPTSTGQENSVFFSSEKWQKAAVYWEGKTGTWPGLQIGANLCSGN